jgi:HK97 family phage portal protein
LAWLFTDVQKSNPIARLLTSRFVGSGEAEPHDTDQKSHLIVYRVNVYAAACMRRIARDVAAAPLLAQKRVRKDGAWQWETQTQGELYDMLQRGNDQEPFDELVERMMLGLLATGNGYWVKARNAKEFYYVKPDIVQVNAAVTGEKVGYTVTDKGFTEKFDIDELIHWRLVNPDGEFYGLPPAETIKETILTKISLNKHVKAFFKFAGLLGTIITSPEDLSEEDIALLHKEINRMYTGEEDAMKTAIMSNGAVASRLSHPLKDFIPDVIDQLVRREVLTAYDMPPILIGHLDGASYANANVQIGLYGNGVLEGMFTVFERALNHQHVKKVFGPDSRVRVDRSEVKALQEDENEKSTRVVAYYRGGVTTLNEAREAAGYDPTEDGGDEFYSQPVPTFSIGNDNGDGSSSGKSHKPSTQTSEDDPNRAFYQRFEKRLTKHEKKLIDKLKSYFAGQLERVIGNLKEVTSAGKMMSAIGLCLTKGSDPNDPDGIFNIELENAILASEISEIIRESVEQGGLEALEELGLDFAFDVKNPEVQNAIEKFVNRIKKINTATYTDIKRLLKDSYDAGDSIEVIAQKLTEKYDFFSKTRARVIARTEMTGVVNNGSFLAAGQVGATHKEWVSTFDANTRDAHVYANGEKVPIKQPFIKTGEAMMFPGDPAGSGYNTINCRCAINYYFEGDST